MIEPNLLDTIVVIPTYNESGNIENLILEILALNDSIGCIVVDDASPDGTSKIVQTLAKKFPGKISLLVRKKERGRATAGICGHQEAIKLHPNHIVEMDADFSHDPGYIKTFLEEITDCDVVLGSRFAAGGADPNRNLYRRMISILSSHILALILGVKIQDIGSGYKLYKREVLESLPWHDFLSQGVSISMEETFRIIKNGYVVKEVPITFRARHSGYSKLSWTDFFEPLKVSMQLVLALGRSS